MADKNEFLDFIKPFLKKDTEFDFSRVRATGLYFSNFRLQQPEPDYSTLPAGLYNWGFTNPHIAILIGTIDISQCKAIYRKVFERGNGPVKLSSVGQLPTREYKKIISFEKEDLKEIPNLPLRGWRNIEDVCPNGNFEDVLRTAEQKAREEGVLLYDESISSPRNPPFGSRERMLYVPEGWKAIVG